MTEHKHHEHRHDHEGCGCDCGCGHEHHEHHGCSCGCGHEHHHVQNAKKEMLEIAISAALFLVGILLKDLIYIVAVVAFVIAYILLGREILKSAVKNIWKGHVFDENFLMSIATLAAFAIGDFAEAVGVMLFFRIGELFEDMAVEKSRSQIMEAVDMRPENVELVHGEGNHTIPASEAKVGDVLLVRNGDRIPLDGVVVEGESRIDTAPVTGEPVPVQVAEGDTIISGCINLAGVLKIRVEKVLEDSMVTRILNSVEHAAANKPKIDRFITRFARVYTPSVVILAVATAIVPSIFTGDWQKWIYTAITFLVISCPCALVLSVPLAFFSGIGVASKKGILFKGGVAIETLPQIKAVVMDKTGTITKGNTDVPDCLKDDSKAAISNLKARRIKTVMLTGDTEERAEAIAKEAGVEEVYARLLPQDKLKYLQEARDKYGKVLFVGDGINDAPALAGADVGAAMASGTDAAVEAADVVFMTSSMQAIPDALEIAKTTNRIAIQNVVFALGVKALVMVLGLFGFANMWMAVFADTGVAMLCVLNSVRILKRK